MTNFTTQSRVFKNINKTYRLGRGVVNKNDINILILDERWNVLFAKREKPEEIIHLEQEMKELLKEQARLIAEQSECIVQKRSFLQKAIDTTAKNIEKKNRQTRLEVKNLWKKIRHINKRLVVIENELKEMPYRIRKANFNLLECLVNTVYISYRKDQRKREELDALIKTTKEKLKYYINEREQLHNEENKTYEYFHDLLGPEELQKLDEQYFAGRYEVTE